MWSEMAEDGKSMAPERNCVDAPTTTSYGNTKSNPTIVFFRYPSLAELSTIATNFKTVNSAAIQVNQGKSCANNNTRSASVNTLNAPWNKQHHNIPATPPKSDTLSSTEPRLTEDPVTPTANLKMLVSAASPAIRDREIKKRELFPGEDHAASYLPSFGSSNYTSNAANVGAAATSSERVTVSRKDKSLGLLCQRFLAKYPEFPPNNQPIEISLDEVAKDLSVERRRIYDIVNVLESVEVISRHAKNRYTWHGKTRLCQTLIRLKNCAESQGLSNKQKASSANPEANKPTQAATRKDKKENCVVSKFLPRLLPKDINVMTTKELLGSKQDVTLKQPVMGQENRICHQDENNNQTKKSRDDYNRKDKSLGVLSQKFLTMFLVSETKYVTLEEAANLLIDEDEQGKAKYKTKVRRLYDIANILSSLELIEKVHVHSIQSGRKPGFRWIGIDPDDLEVVSKQGKELKEPPPVKRTCTNTSSELPENDESAVGRLISRRPSQQQLMRNKASSTSKLPRSRSHQVLGSHHRSTLLQSEDGFSLKELAGSPTEQKFRAELKKLHAQYPDRMSQLLSACKEGFPSEVPDRKSRRTLFLKPNAADDGPSCKRSKPDDSPTATPPEQFVHSSTSPFKVVQGSGSEAITETPDESQQGAEQKVLLERLKQQELLEEQKDFKLQDDRWTRIQQELDKAFPACQPKVTGTNGPVAVHQSSSPLPLDLLIEQSSVGIQANLIEDVSPLKPPSYYRNVLKSPWKPIPRSDATPSPDVIPSFPERTLSPLQLQVQSSSGNVSLIRVTPPSGQSTPSPSPLVKAPGQIFNSPALYSPRSLTTTPTPTGDVLQTPDPAMTESLVANVAPSNCDTPVTKLLQCGSQTEGSSETPGATSQLLCDVSKRLSLPQC